MLVLRGAGPFRRRAIGEALNRFPPHVAGLLRIARHEGELRELAERLIVIVQTMEVIREPVRFAS